MPNEFRDIDIIESRTEESQELARGGQDKQEFLFRLSADPPTPWEERFLEECRMHGYRGRWSAEFRFGDAVISCIPDELQQAVYDARATMREVNRWYRENIAQQQARAAQKTSGDEEAKRKVGEVMRALKL